MLHSLRLLLVFGTVAWWAGSAAALFVPTVDTRYVGVYYESFCPGCGPEGEDVLFIDSDGLTASGFNPFSAFVDAGSTYTATQNSSVSAALLTGSGQAGGETGEVGNATSVYDITFDVDGATPYDISGTLENSSSGATLNFQLLQDGNVVHDYNAESVFGSSPFAFSGVLLPGSSYRVIVEATINESIGQLNWSFSMSAVPEPGTAVLLALGAAGLGSIRSRRATGRR